MPHNLEADSMRYRIGERQLLADVYLTCATGEIVGLLGRNGCGKSTLLQIIFGTRHTDNKHIRIDGQVYAAPYKVPGQLAYLPQRDFLPHDIKLDKIVNLYLTDPAQRAAVKQHERVQPHLAKHAHELSKGELRYFSLLLLLQLDVKFLLLDEPFSGIEPLYIGQIQELLQAHLSSKGFIITDHQYHAVLEISHRAILLADGICHPIAHPEELVQWGYVPAGIF